MHSLFFLSTHSLFYHFLFLFFFLHTLSFSFFLSTSVIPSPRPRPPPQRHLVIDGLGRLTPWKVVSYNGCTEIIYELVNDSLEFSVNNHTKLIFSLNSVISIFRIDQKKCKRNVCSYIAYFVLCVHFSCKLVLYIIYVYELTDRDKVSEAEKATRFSRMKSNEQSFTKGSIPDRES